MQIQMQNSDAAVNAADADSATDSEIETLEHYIRIRDGIKPSVNRREKEQLLWAYQDSFEKSRRFEEFQQPTTMNCARFTKLYSTIGKQTIDLHERLLNNHDMPLELLQNTQARLATLKLFEFALFNLIIGDSEGGYSTLDDNDTQVCVANDRAAFKVAVVKAHNDLQSLHEKTFGLISPRLAESPADYMVAPKTKEANHKTAEAFGLVTAYIFVSGWIWMKSVVPKLRQWRKNPEHSPVARRAVPLSANLAYFATYAVAVQAVDACMAILHPTVNLFDPHASSYLNLINAGEQLTSLKLITPSVHFEYLKLISDLNRVSAQSFFIQNQAVINHAHNQYGSVDLALEHLKQEQKNENHEYKQAN